MTYDEAFYVEQRRVALESAEIVLPRIMDVAPFASVVDVGCGTGAWTFAAQEFGCRVIGIDLGVPEAVRYSIPYSDADLTGGFPCDGFDLAICLEVAEHLLETSAQPLVAGLTQAGTVLFSAATPGQPGVGHVNCQEHDYWHTLFAEHGYTPTHVGAWFDAPVADFYRRNMFLYQP